MGIIVPHGALFRSSAQSGIRNHLVDTDLLECVIGLGLNLSYGTGISAFLMIFRLKKQPLRKNKVLFIDASELHQKGRAHNFFLAERANTVARAKVHKKSSRFFEEIFVVVQSLNHEINSLPCLPFRLLRNFLPRFRSTVSFATSG